MFGVLHEFAHHCLYDTDIAIYHVVSQDDWIGDVHEY